MTHNERRTHAALHSRSMKRMEAPFISPVAMAIRSQIIKIETVLMAHGIEEAKRENEKILVNEELHKPISDLYKVFGLYMARRTTREINRSAKAIEQKAGFGIDEELLKSIIAYLQQFIFIRVIIPITQTTRELILKTIIRGEQEGWGISKIVSELGTIDMTVSRAYTIVRTESLKAMQYGQKVAASSSRWQSVNQWISAHDDRTRHSHRIVDGMKVDEGQRFPVPIFKTIKGVDYQQGVDLMTGPGDPFASAGNVINCRCTLVTVAKRDQNGRLVLKPRNTNISVILE